MKAEQVSAHNLPFFAEISYEIKGLRFDQMKISGRGTEPKKLKLCIFNSQ